MLILNRPIITTISIIKFAITPHFTQFIFSDILKIKPMNMCPRFFHSNPSNFIVSLDKSCNVYADAKAVSQPAVGGIYGNISSVAINANTNPAIAGIIYLFSHFKSGFFFNFTRYGTKVLVSTPANTAKKTIQLNSIFHLLFSSSFFYFSTFKSLKHECR